MEKLKDDCYAFLAATNIQNENLLLLDPAALEKQIKQRHHNAGFKTVTELPMTENGTGVVNGDRISLFLCDGKGVFKQLSNPTWGVNHLAVSADSILFSAFPFADIKKVTEGLYRYSLDSAQTETLLPDDQYSIDYADFWNGGVICLALSMKDYGVYEHPTFLFLDRAGVHPLLHYDRRVTDALVTDSYAGHRREQCVSGKTLYFLNTDGTDGHLCTFSATEEIRTLIGGSISILDFSVWNGEILYVAFAGLQLPEVYLWKNGAAARITHLHDAFLAERQLSCPEHFTFRDHDNVEIDGFVLKPLEYDPARRYPAILHIHGGPKMVFSSVFHHEMQLWAAEGYFVCFCNPRGSCGKGNAFAELRGQLGSMDYQDLMEFTDECLHRYPAIDTDRFAVCGGSYGGFMTNWIIGHTNRFRCAVSQRSIADYRIDYLLSDIGYWFVPDQHLATLWKHEARLWDDSPLRYAPQVTTPTLFIHSDQDFRCPLANGLEMFAALKLHGVETKLCMFYGENHDLSRTGTPRNRICRMEQILMWFNAHLKEEKHDEL